MKNTYNSAPYENQLLLAFALLFNLIQHSSVDTVTVNHQVLAMSLLQKVIVHELVLVSLSKIYIYIEKFKW